MDSPKSNIVITDEWWNAVDSIAAPLPPPSPITLICGPKNAGKSVLSRYLVNTLLLRYEKVAYLDTDVGQPEFTVPGFLSLCVVDRVNSDLTGPCLKRPKRSYFYGDISSKRDPAYYLKCVDGLFGYFVKKYRKSGSSRDPDMVELPLVINTPGWVKGTGYDVLVQMVDKISPTHIIKINISAESMNLPPGAFWLEPDEVHSKTAILEIRSARHDSQNRSILVGKKAALERDLRVKAYFRQCFPSSAKITTNKELARALASLCPYQVPISSVKIKHLHCQVPSTEIFYSLNASIVGLAVDTEESADVPPCVGIGIVRAVDLSNGLIYVLTPVPPKTLDKVNVLLQGFLPIPMDLLRVNGCVSPYFATNFVGRGIAMPLVNHQKRSDFFPFY